VARLLLIGNSRWHWAEPSATAGGLRCWHTPPADALDGDDLQAWAAVGSLPRYSPSLAGKRLELGDVPLKGAPPWLGIDRALVGWWAWQQQQKSVLVADAGTALSLTRVSAEGCFEGGLISAGVALQLKALSGSTARLPDLDDFCFKAGQPAPTWPHSTDAAMGEGCRRAVAAGIALAAAEAAGSCLWLTGGDAALVLPLLTAQQLEPVHAPDLALEAMAALAVVGWHR
jgi:type III pantothenate kinase